jgi:hypothetical protein
LGIQRTCSYPSDAEWTNSRVDRLPKRWAKRLLKRWEQVQAEDYPSANRELRVQTEELFRVQIPLDASDQEICDAADRLSALCTSRAEIFHSAPDLRAAMNRICTSQGIEAPPDKCKDGPAIARMTCPHWWRRKLRRHQGRVVEAAAIRLGYVNKTRDLYISNERLRTRTQQHARNTAILESTIARNEDGQEFTLAELAARGPGNKKIRRSELMTRISGFERIGREQGHRGFLITLTCPSRFHPSRTVGPKIIPNPKFDARETPLTAQKYLSRVWARIRSALARRGTQLYGMRVAQPQHDGTRESSLRWFCERSSDDTAIRPLLRLTGLKPSLASSTRQSTWNTWEDAHPVEAL